MTTKTSTKDFKLFQKECHKWMDKWELNNWDIRFCHEKMNRYKASIRVDGNCYNATIALNTEITHGTFKEEVNRVEYIKMLSKHEITHLLLGRLVNCGESRWCTDSEMETAEEELVRKLIKII